MRHPSSTAAYGGPAEQAQQRGGHIRRFAYDAEHLPSGRCPARARSVQFLNTLKPGPGRTTRIVPSARREQAPARTSVPQIGIFLAVESQKMQLSIRERRLFVPPLHSCALLKRKASWSIFVKPKPSFYPDLTFCHVCSRGVS